MTDKYNRNKIVGHKYCDSLTQYSRRKTIEVKVGDIPLGGDNRVRVQSMTSTSTKDIKATVEQCIKIIEAGADYVRITVPSIKEVECLSGIVSELREKGYNSPIIADIHFNPEVAIRAATIAEKIRINPGNFADRKRYTKYVYTEKEFADNVEQLKEKFIVLLNVCKKNNTALRIGTNHGSLSDRIMNRYGDTPEGMAESAMEYLRICKEEHFNNVVVSMKSSNTRIMVQSNRLLVNRMLKENMKYPLHTGVTEAGEGDDGRIKSAAGIGALLADGIGDTIRISLTENPEKEIPVAKKLIDYFADRGKHKSIKEISDYKLNPFQYKKRITHSVYNLGGKYHPVVISDLSDAGFSSEALSKAGWRYGRSDKNWTFSDIAADYLFLNETGNEFDIPDGKGIITDHKIWKEEWSKRNNFFPLFSLADYFKEPEKSEKLNFVKIFYDDLKDRVIEKLGRDSTLVFVSETNNKNGFAEQRALFCKLINEDCNFPVIIKRNYSENDREDFQIKSAADCGGLFLDGLGDGIWLTNKGKVEPGDITSTSFGILQACRARISKTEFISCPSCGRTNFNIQEVAGKIRKRTSHLKGLKIAVMGCIVNGPGEMADADYGYIGSGRNRVTLFKARTAVKKNIPEDEAVDKLISLIKENGDWQELPEI
jgi:(E)-4-hydroxy-3-methylbut-2-enyl-diphosphate synthase